MGAAAAVATNGVIDHWEGAVEFGEHAWGRLQQLQHERVLVEGARGLGLALVVQLAGDRRTSTDAAQRIFYHCLSSGLSFKTSDGNVLTSTPPLTVSRDQLDAALDLVQEAIVLETKRYGRS